MKRKIIGIGICMLMIAAVVLPAAGTINEKVTRENKFFENQTSIEFIPGEFIVKLKKDATFSKSLLTTLNEKYQVYAFETVFPNAEGTILDNIYLLHVPIGSDILSIVREYASCPDVVYAEPNGMASPCGIPNDANFNKQWYMHDTGKIFWIKIFFLGGKIHIKFPFIVKHGTNIQAPAAWDIETGSPDVVIAIVDSGIDYTHPDLAAKIWNNTDEIPGNGIDDDHNGYIDDVNGWDFYYNDSNIKDGCGHATMCAGVAAASANNGIGIAGIACNCKIMPVRIANDSWWSNVAELSAGIKYAADNGANVISMSFGFDTNYYTLRNAVNYAYSKGVFLCAAAHNYNSSAEIYPAAYENVTAVAATNQKDKRCTPRDWGTGLGSDYGDWVDIAAPGNYIYTTMPTYHVTGNDWWGYKQNYDYVWGTSLSTPMVAGVAALLLSKDPSLTPAEVKAFLCNNVDPYNSDHYIGTGRLNAYKALSALTR